MPTDEETLFAEIAQPRTVVVKRKLLRLMPIEFGLVIFMLIALGFVVFHQLYLIPDIILFLLLLIGFAGLLVFLSIGIAAPVSLLIYKLKGSPTTSQPPAIRLLYYWILLAGLAFLAFSVSSQLFLRGAFFLVRPTLEVIAKLDDPSKEKGRFLGFWFPDDIQRDMRGGIYIRLADAMDMIDTDYMGFAYQPNKTGSPWGSAKYRIIPIYGDWHIFYSNNDY